MPNEPIRLLILVSGAEAAHLERREFSLGGLKFRTEPLFQRRMDAAGSPFGINSGGPEWFLALAEPEDRSPWDAAHDAAGEAGLSLTPGFTYVEPDVLHEWPTPTSHSGGDGLAATQPCEFRPADGFWPNAGKFAWHLDDAYSGLATARAVEHSNVRVAHLDTGYSDHKTQPRNIRTELRANFVEGGTDSRDPGTGRFWENTGHGTATLAILAGGGLVGMARPEHNLGIPLGGAPDAQIVPIRIADSVVHYRTSAMARGIDWAIAPHNEPDNRCDVVSISMGGVASKAWAAAVNRAYENGVCIVAAAGNNVSVGSPHVRTPLSLVYPARFHRVIAVTGITADLGPYFNEDPHESMQGNFGPTSRMRSALGAFTPNMPWAQFGCSDLIMEDGAGTSCATPQVAAAAALWLAKHQPDYDAPWKRVEAVRQALFRKARKWTGYDRQRIGYGALDASAALSYAPPRKLTKAPEASVSWSMIRIISGYGIAPAQLEMLEVEACQLLHRSSAVSEAVKDPDNASPSGAAMKRFMNAVIEDKQTSRTLRRFVEQAYLQRFGTVPTRQPYKHVSEVAPTPAEIPSPAVRILRGYAFDPSVSNSLETVGINHAEFRVRWEKIARPRDGSYMAGEYIKIDDRDFSKDENDDGSARTPAIDLNDTSVLAQQGLTPSMANAQFHQQMVYAVGMTTIEQFERAWGRPVMWAPKEESNSDADPRFVQHLTAHPRAMRMENAFYSPSKRALYFGYFPARSADMTRQYPGGMTFTSLSHDIIAHEMTHAILDGIHPRYKHATNPDMLAFHEAFADIVALFQRFTFPEVIRHQIAKTRNELSTSELLTGLAHEYGAATGRRGALREFVGTDPVPSLYETLSEPHARGAILVSAIYDAFNKIYNDRVSDLLRIASDGTGIVRPGTLPNDLLNRLTGEASRVARQMMNICIRALDYCPPVDVTFGDYLRALITADFDAVPDDTLGYRLAFLEAFRRRGIYPRDVAALSVESLRWQTAQEVYRLGNKNPFTRLIEVLRVFAGDSSFVTSREHLFDRTTRARKDIFDAMPTAKETNLDPRRLEKMFGFEYGKGAPEPSVDSIRIARRTRKDGTDQAQAIIELTQEVKRPLDNNTSGKGPTFGVFGGCTAIIDLKQATLQYLVVKRLKDTGEARVERIRKRMKKREDPAVQFNAAREPFAQVHSAEPHRPSGHR